MESPEETGQEERETQGEVTGQGRPRLPKMAQSAEGGEGKDKRERIIVVVRGPCHKNDPADAHPSAHKSVLESANPEWTRSVHLDAPGQWHGQQPVSGTADPGVVKQDKSSRGSVDTTKTPLDPERVGMYSGERPKASKPTPRPHATPPPPAHCTCGPNSHAMRGCFLPSDPPPWGPCVITAIDFQDPNQCH